MLTLILFLAARCIPKAIATFCRLRERPHYQLNFLLDHVIAK